MLMNRIIIFLCQKRACFFFFWILGHNFDFLVCGSTFKVLNGKQPVCAVGLSHFQNKRHSYEPKQNFVCNFNKLATKSIVLISIHNILFFFPSVSLYEDS